MVIKALTEAHFKFQIKYFGQHLKNYTPMKLQIKPFHLLLYKIYHISFTCWGRRGRDRMVVGFKTTYAISAYHH